VSGPALVALDVGGSAEPWTSIGLTAADGVSQVGDVTFRYEHLVTAGAARGGLGGADPRLGAVRDRGTRGPRRLPTVWLPEPVTPNQPVEHPLGVTALDHVVVASPDPRRTFACFESAGLQLRLEREAGSAQRPLVQGFFRDGQARIEVVGPAEPSDDGPATFWGLTLVVEDLDAAVAELGPERCGPARDAVQPGRRIAALTRAAGLPLRVALMTPEP
jgi:hypothetical protein